MFTLGAITCPDCSTALAVADFTANDSGMRATALLRCTSCGRKFELVATLTSAGPATQPAAAPAVAKPEPEGFEDLQHVDASDPPAKKPAGKLAAYMTDDGFYVCPECPPVDGRNVVFDDGRAFAGHLKTHEVAVACVCGKLIKPSGRTRHLTSCPGTTTPSQEDQPCPPTPPTPPPPPKQPDASPPSPSSSQTASAATTASTPSTPPKQPPSSATEPSSTSTSDDPRSSGASAASTATAPTAGTPATTSPAAAPPTAPSTSKAPTSATASRTAPARTTRKASTIRAAAADAEPPAAPPLRGRSSWACGYLYSKSAGTCGTTKIDSDRGWKRARVVVDGRSDHVDLCPSHRDASPAELCDSVRHARETADA